MLEDILFRMFFILAPILDTSYMEHDTLDSIVMTDKPLKDLEGADGILAMGIISIVLLGGIGMVLAIITLVKSGKALLLYKDFQFQYTEKSYKKVKAGKICAIVSLSLFGAFLVMVAGRG